MKINVGILWATPDEEKFGYKILKNEQEKWNNIFPINPKYEEIKWEKCYNSLEKVDLNILDLMIFVVNPKITKITLEKNLEKLKNLKLWFQPWTFDLEILDFCKKHNLNFEAQNCILKV